MMAAAAFTALIFSVSCSKDDSGDQTPSTPENTDIAGNYSGTLSVSVPGSDSDTPTTQAQNITVSWSENSTEAIDLSVADFAFGNIELGSIDLNSIPVTVDGDTYTFATDGAQSVTVGEGESSMTCTIEAHGTVTDGTMNLTLDITANLVITEINVDATFTGSKVVAE